jgi:hypothetical protein
MMDQLAGPSPWNKENVIALAMTLRGLRMRSQIKFKDLFDGAGLLVETDENSLPRLQQRFSRWLQNVDSGDKWKALREEEYYAIAQFLATKPNLYSNDSKVAYIDNVYHDAVYHALVKWFGMTDSAFEQLKNDFCGGAYAVYRHSLINPNHVFIGKLTITYDEQSKAIVTHEEYHADESHTLKEHDSELTGYMFRRHGKHRILSKDTATDELQYIYITNFGIGGQKDAGTHVTHMIGVVMDIHIQDPFATKVVFEWVKEADDIELKTIPLDQIPARVAHLIGRRPEYTKGDEYIIEFP